MNFDPRVYLVLDKGSCPGDILSLADQALSGGVTCLQYRDKSPGTRAMIGTCLELAALCRKHGAAFIVNDRADVALAAGADGVHLGADDLPYESARRILGPSAVIGLTVHDMAELEESNGLRPEYIGLGPVCRTTTKADLTVPPWGTGGLAYARTRTSLPIVAIGGIHAENGAGIIRAGADGLAVASAICGADDPRTAAAGLRALWD